MVWIKNGISILKKEALLVSLFLTTFIIAIYMPLNKVSYTDFNRLLGQATTANYSISKVINHFFFWYVIAMPGTFVVVFYIVSKIFNSAIIKDKRVIEIIKKLNLFTAIASFALLVGVINRFIDQRYIFSVTILFTISIVVITVLYIWQIDKMYFNENDLKWTFIISFVLYFPSSIIFNILNIKVSSAIIYTIIVILSLSILQALCCKYRDSSMVEEIKRACTPMAFSMFILSLTLEIINILNQYEIFITHKFRTVMLMYLVVIISCITIFKLNRKKRICKKYYWEKYYYIGIITSLAMLMVQPSLQTIVNTDFFEQANGAVSISQLFLFGEVPFVETHGAHLFTDYIWGILYGVLNKDLFGALFSPYAVYQFTLTIIIMYFMLKQCFDREFAFIFVIFYPIIGITVLYSHICVISILALTYVLKKRNTKSYYVFWSTLAISVLYQGDAGLAFGIASIMVLIIMSIIRRNIINFKKFSLSFCVVTSILGVIFFIICQIKDIKMIDRIKEFLDIMKNSNQNWAYAWLGDTTWSAFSYVYFFIPVIVVGLIIHLTYSILNKNVKVSDRFLAIVLTLGVAYLVNVPRILTRHSLVENNVGVRLFSAGLFIAMTMAILVKRNRKIVFCVVYFGLGLFSIVIENNRNFSGISVLENSMNTFDNGNLINRDIVSEKVKRVDTSQEMKSQYIPLVNELDRLLEDDQTYIDFTNQSLIYSLSGRNNPVFVNQSPGLLSGEFTQEKFIEQIEKIKDQIPLALLPLNNTMPLSIELDGVANAFRYYKVSEYIYNNYEPLEIVGNFVVWCRKELKDNFKKELSYQEYNISEDKYSQLIFSDAVGEYDHGSIQVLAGAKDPIMDGIQNLFEYKGNSNEILKLGIEYNTSSPGEIQLFYTQNNQEGYSEEKSIKQYIQNNGWMYFEVPYSEDMRLRLDPPSESEFIIYNISVGNAVLCDYDYGDRQQLHVYNLGDIPYLWGTYDQKKAYNNEVIVDYTSQEEIYGLNIDEIDKSKGNYLLVTIECSEDTLARVKFGKRNERGIESLNEFNFNVKMGINTYLIRVSTDFNWYATDMLDAFIIDSESNFVLKKVQLLQGD